MMIVNVSSELESLATHNNRINPDYEIYDAYTSSKITLNAFTVMLANEFRDANSKINSVSPGYTGTDLNQHRGTQTVEQEAKFSLKYATLGIVGPTGKFFKEEEIPW